MGKKRLHHLALATLLFAPWLLSSAKSQSPAVSVEALPAAQTTNSRHCVLLKNNNVLFGRAYQVGEFVIVQTGMGGEVQLPRKDVVCWAGSIRDLYRYRVDHRQEGDVAAHLRDAKWCLRYDLLDLAAEEIRAAKTIDPGNVQAKSIEDQLRRTTSPTLAVYSNLTGKPAPVQHTGFEDASPDLSSGDLRTLRGFARYVQPMLLNRCGRCHSHDSGRGWTLLLPPSGARASSRMTRENLAASLPYISRSEPEESELLVKATTPHGGGPLPLDPRSAKAIQSFKIWLATASNALPKSPADRNASGRNASDRQVPIQTPLIADRREVMDDVRVIDDVRVMDDVRVIDDTNASDDGRDDPPARLPQVTNPFDPNLFNRRFHADSRGSE